MFVMKMILFTAALLFVCLADHTQAQERDYLGRYQTPEYSGPMARIEAGGMEHAGSPAVVRTPSLPRASANDKIYDKQIERRDRQLSQDYERRREEARRGYVVNE